MSKIQEFVRIRKSEATYSITALLFLQMHRREVICMDISKIMKYISTVWINIADNKGQRK